MVAPANYRRTRWTDSCGKMRFTSAAAAQQAAERKGAIHQSYFRVYKCPRCLDYHLTTQST